MQKTILGRRNDYRFRGITRGGWGICLFWILVFFSFTCQNRQIDSQNSLKPSKNTEYLTKKSTPKVILTTQSGRVLSIAVELARTPAEQQRGLMFRKELAEMSGMLFLFEDDQIRAFWMKNTLISLDMIFISKTKEVVGIVHKATPKTHSPRRVPYPSRYVLEVVGGFSQQYGIARGDRVRFEAISE